MHSTKTRRLYHGQGSTKAFSDHMALWGRDCFPFDYVYYYTACHTIN